jgi:hypothetical protein
MTKLQQGGIQESGIRFVPHPVLGFMSSPNVVDKTVDAIAVCGTRVRYRMSSDAEGRRPTSRTPRLESAENVFVFGCSASYGWLLSDEDTYSWLLQESLPEANVYSFAEPGYGTHHALLQLMEQIRAGRIPKVCVIAYLPTMADGPWGHPDRNVANPINIYAIASQSEFSEYISKMSFPRAKIDPEGRVSISYIPMDLRGLDDVPREAIEVDRVHTHFVTAGLVDVIMGLAKQHGFTVLWAKLRPDNLDTIARTLSERFGIEMLDLVVPLDDPNALEYRVAKADSHPSALSHRIYHDRLIEPIRRALAKTAVKAG